MLTRFVELLICRVPRQFPTFVGPHLLSPVFLSPTSFLRPDSLVPPPLSLLGFVKGCFP